MAIQAQSLLCFGFAERRVTPAVSRSRGMGAADLAPVHERSAPGRRDADMRGKGRAVLSLLIAALLFLALIPGALAYNTSIALGRRLLQDDPNGVPDDADEGNDALFGRVNELSHDLGVLLRQSRGGASASGTSVGAAGDSSGAPPKRKLAKVAVCLCGGIRMLELTGPSTMRYLFAAYTPADVFIFSTVDADAHKIGLLFKAPAAAMKNKWRLRAVTFNADIPLDDEAPEAAILDPVISGRGILLHTFELIEGCIILVKEAEKNRGGTKYDWVLRARPDSFWSGPPPPLETLNNTVFTSPSGFEWGGVNDRFAIMGRVIAEDALTRLSRLNFTLKEYRPPNDTFNQGQVNGEQALKWQLLSHKVPVVYDNINFCIMTRHHWPKVEWPLKSNFPPVFSLSTTVPLNGAYCAPCHPFLTGEEAVECLETGMEGKNLPFHRPRPFRLGWNLCNSAKKWPPDWEQVFDAQVGPDARRSRKMYATMDESECVRRLSMVISLVDIYRGPNAYILCRVRFWDPVFKAAKSGAPADVSRLLALAESKKLNETVDVITDVPHLGEWKLKGPSWTVQPKACPVLFTIIGTREQLYLKPQVKDRLLRAGLEMLRCGGNFTHEVCLAIYPPRCME